MFAVHRIFVPAKNENMTAMSWFMTTDTAEFLNVAGEFLRAEAARNSVMLTVTADLEAAGPGAGDSGMLFGWQRPEAGPPTAAFMHTPGYPVMLSGMSETAAAALARDFAGAGHQVPGINAAQQAADAFTVAWRERTGDPVTVYRRMRLFRLARLVPPVSAPEGSARPAAGTDRDLLDEWFGAFAREVGDIPAHDHRSDIDKRLGYGGITLWEDGSVPVSVACLTRAVGGMARVGPVYTPPALRGRGYAGAATAAVSRAALDAGVREVVLYTDLANPTSNALYERLGYRAVEDRVLLSFEPAATLHP
jgi:GNAT superfamily N-acetyltransferase